MKVYIGPFSQRILAWYKLLFFRRGGGEAIFIAGYQAVWTYGLKFPNQSLLCRGPNGCLVGLRLVVPPISAALAALAGAR